MSFNQLLREPDRVFVQTDNEIVALEHTTDGWGIRDISVTFALHEDTLDISISASQTPVQRVHVRWGGEMANPVRILGDHWERGYGDLEWRGIVSERPLPWYCLIYDGHKTHGYGVKTGANALCFWRCNPAGISLWMDVRSGGVGVRLGDRRLNMATVVTRQGNEQETTFRAAQAFCRLMCDAPLRVKQPVYGSNNWYYAYGNSSHDDILLDTEILVSASPSGGNRPFMTIDDGWQPSSRHDGGATGGPWTHGNAKFPDMPGLADAIREQGARPGIWVRPIGAPINEPENLLLPSARMTNTSDRERMLDPSIPENLARIEADFARIRRWGYELIKHDFTTYDILGRWGFEMNSELTTSGWCFSDQSRTTAEIILALYRAIRRGAGDAIIIGCNTIGHLGAGLFEIQRTGDDTSGREWERTRKMGINTLAFRMPQHGTFFEADADCVGLTHAVPWELNRQWMDLLARSGTAFFVSADPKALGLEQKEAIRQAFEIAAQPQIPGEPLDWLEDTCPRTWKFGEELVTYDWYGDAGIATP